MMNYNPSDLSMRVFDRSEVQFSDRDKRVIVLFLYSFIKHPTQIYEYWMENFPETAPSESTITRWVERFSTGHLSVEDEPRPGRPSDHIGAYYGNTIAKLIQENPKITLDELANECHTSETTVRKAVEEELGYRIVQHQWVPPTP